MGGSSSSQAKFDPAQSGWVLQDQNGQFNVWRNQATGEQLEEYRQVFNDQREFNFERDMFQLRYNSNNLVASRYYREDLQKDMCSTFYKGNLFIERVPVRLSQINEIPYPDALHLYQQAFRGFAELHDKVGYFDVEEDCICMNQQGRVKTWCNSDLSLSYPEHRLTGVQGTEADMVRKTLAIINSNVDQSTFPQNLAQMYNQTQPQTFRDAHALLEQYCARHRVAVPNQLDCVLEMRPQDLMNGGRARVSRRSNGTANFGPVQQQQSFVGPNTTFGPGQIIQGFLGGNQTVNIPQVQPLAPVSSQKVNTALSYPQPSYKSATPVYSVPYTPAPSFPAINIPPPPPVVAAPAAFPITQSRPVATNFRSTAPVSIPPPTVNFSTQPTHAVAIPPPPTVNPPVRTSMVHQPIGIAPRSITPQPSTATFTSVTKPVTAIAGSVTNRYQPAPPVVIQEKPRVASQYTPEVKFNILGRNSSFTTPVQQVQGIRQPPTLNARPVQTVLPRANFVTSQTVLPAPTHSARPAAPSPLPERIPSNKLIQTTRGPSTSVHYVPAPPTRVVTQQQNLTRPAAVTQPATQTRTTVTNHITTSAPQSVSQSTSYKQAAEEMIRRISQRDNINVQSTLNSNSFGTTPLATFGATDYTYKSAETIIPVTTTNSTSFGKTPAFGAVSLQAHHTDKEGGYSSSQIIGLLNKPVSGSVTTNTFNPEVPSYVTSSVSKYEYSEPAATYEPSPIYDYTPITNEGAVASYASAYDKDTASYGEYSSYKYTSTTENYNYNATNTATYGTSYEKANPRTLNSMEGADELRYSMYAEQQSSSNMDAYASPSALANSPSAMSKSNTGGAFYTYNQTQRYESSSPNSYEYNYKLTTTAENDNEPYKVEMDNDLMADLQRLKTGQTSKAAGVVPTSSSMSFGTSY